MIILNGNSENISKSDISSRNNRRARFKYSLFMFIAMSLCTVLSFAALIYVSVISTPLKEVISSDDVSLWKEFYTNNLLAFAVSPFLIFLLNLLDIRLARRYRERGMKERAHDVSCWKMFNRMMPDIKASLAPGEKVLACARGTKKAGLSLEGSILMIAAAGFLFLVPILSPALFVGDYYFVLRCFAYVLLLIFCAAPLKVIHPFSLRGLALNALIMASLLYLSLVSHQLFSHSSFVFPFMPNVLFLLSVFLTAAEIFLIYFQPHHRLLVVTDRKVHVFSANFIGKECKPVASIESLKSLTVKDSHSGVQLLFVEGNNDSFDELFFATRKESYLVRDFIKEKHTEWNAAFEEKRKGFFIFQLFRECKAVLLLLALMSAVTAHAQNAVTFELTLTGAKIAGGIRDWTKGQPENLHHACKFVLKLSPRNGVAAALLGWSAYDLGRYNESIAALKKAGRLSGGMDGQIKNTVNFLLPQVIEQRKHIRACLNVYNESYGVTRDAYKDYCKAKSIYEVRANYRNYVYSLFALADALKKNPNFKEANELFQTLQARMRKNHVEKENPHPPVPHPQNTPDTDE